jgi:hypothetical protein
MEPPGQVRVFARACHTLVQHLRRLHAVRVLFCLRHSLAEPFEVLSRASTRLQNETVLQGKAIMKLLPVLTASCLYAVAYTSSALAAETPASEVAAEESGDVAASEPTADKDVSSEEEAPAADDREAKNAIYLDLAGPGLFYSINYDRVITPDISARIGFSYLSIGASASGGAGTTASAEFSYWAIPITASYMGIGSTSNMFEVGGGGVIMNVSGSGIVESSDESAEAGASFTTLALTALAGYRHQPADGGFVFRIGLSPEYVLGAGLLPWGYMSLGAAF